MAHTVLGLCNLHSGTDLGPLTANRTMASTSFLGRYAFIDFALSNLCNSGIDDVGILIKDHPRSILRHLGSMTAWIENTKIGRETIMFNEHGILNPPYNHDISNIVFNEWVLNRSNPDYIVIHPVHIVSTIDFAPILKEHIERNEQITVVYTHLKNADEAFMTSNILSLDKNRYVIGIKKNDRSVKEADVSMESYIINRSTMYNLIKKAEKTNALFGLKEIIAEVANKIIPVHAYEYIGYARCFDSLEHFMKYSLELLNASIANQLFLNDWPIYTLTHDTPPSIYGEFAKVKNSFVANGAIVEGRVEGSIVSRNVKVHKNAYIKDSIILSKSVIGDGVELENVLIDKYCTIHDNTKLKGTKSQPLYIPQGAVI
ncbi:MAG: glucose-1-phosphate adenylyltransferase subunit GlgD [Bacilli bacterium]|jgi:glucose-1-phosphate adenylyltransferase